MSESLHHAREGIGVPLRAVRVRYDVLAIRLVMLVGAMVFVLLEYGTHAAPLPTALMEGAALALMIGYGLDVWVGLWFGRLAMAESRPKVGEGVVLVVGVAAGVCQLLETRLPHEVCAVTFVAALGLLLASQLWRLNLGLSRSMKRPALLLPMSFLFLIASCTLLLKLPVAAAPGQTIGWLDALFTSTSAVCVTGLVVRDTATEFSAFGQAIIGLFIQLGGLGILIFGTVMALLLGARVTLREHVSLSQMLNDQPLHQLIKLVKFIVLSTLAIEAVGAALLFPMWPTELPVLDRVGLSLFHSVSAFCNAGFALQSDSLVGYRYAFGVHLVMAPLLVIGGLGFPLLQELVRVGRWRLKYGWRRELPMVGDRNNLGGGRLSLHAKLVLTTTAALYLLGFVGIGLAELTPWVHHWAGLGQTANQVAPEASIAAFGGVITDASFMSLTARTAGFNTMPMEELQPASNWLIMLLMAIGGSPGGTAGGVKTMTLAVLVLGIVATLRGREEAQAFGRQISDALLRKAGTVALAFVVLVGLATMLLLMVEPFPLQAVLFEVVSAASTTGLSLGVTGQLTGFSQVVIIVVMFLGRVGFLTLLAALFMPGQGGRSYELPHEEVALG